MSVVQPLQHVSSSTDKNVRRTRASSRVTRRVARHRSGDLMARAINDIGLVRRMVGVGTRC